MNPLPNKIRPDDEGTGLYSKTSGAARGSVGVFTYDLSHNEYQTTKKMAVMFFVPFDYNIYDYNYFAVGICDKYIPCDYNLYSEMCCEDPTWFFRGVAGNTLHYEEDHISITASMTDSNISTLSVHVEETSGIMSKTEKM